MKFLNGAIAPYDDRLTFLKTQVVFWLLVAIDGTLIKFSIFVTPDGYRLTPLCDVVSAASYPQFPVQKSKLAMAVGNTRYYLLSQIQQQHFLQTAQKVDLKERARIIQSGPYSELMIDGVVFVCGNLYQRCLA